MNKQFKSKSEHRMIKVIDDWYPCYPEKKIRITIALQVDKPYAKAPEDKWMYYVIISAQGIDDTGVKLEHISLGHRESAEFVYNFWKEHIFDKVSDGVDMMWFYEHGFLPV